ncbi:ribbon-helix-helix domain-containing protein [Halobaculum sp. D14]|uniref:ribbon-helix-helix domain-containing protein n=1 Tax=unclassified Halobaculum TaxID=2640896 RepID=UPI003EBD404C
MAKDTVRYPDAVVEEIDRLVDDGVFESKSEFYRFSAEYVLALVDDDWEPETFNYADLREELDLDEEPVLIGADGGRDFLSAVITVRQYGLRNDFAEAEQFIDENYDPTDRPGMILEELLRGYRERGGGSGQPAPDGY